MRKRILVVVVAEDDRDLLKPLFPHSAFDGLFSVPTAKFKVTERKDSLNRTLVVFALIGCVDIVVGSLLQGRA